MKISTFLFKTLKSFRNGKGYIRPNYETNPRWYFSKGRSLTEGLSHVQAVTGEKMKNKAEASIAKSLGHTNIYGFERSATFKTVETVLKAAIKRERASGN